MRIISGRYKGALLSTPDHMKTRPTKSRVRQAISNALRPWPKEASILDLFAGSGSVGFELLSQSGRQLTLLDHCPKALQCLKKNSENLRKYHSDSVPVHIQKVDLMDLATVFVGNVKLGSEPFDLIWADPPYQLVPEWLATNLTTLINLLTQDGKLCIECDLGPENFSTLIEGRMAIDWHRRYGETQVYFLTKNSKIDLCAF